MYKSYFASVTAVLVIAFSLCSGGASGENINPPKFIGGPRSYDSLVVKHAILPHEVFDSCIYGTVVISFLVRTDGSIDSFTTRHSVHPLIDQQCYGILMETDGRWLPGTIDGKPVNMRITRHFKCGRDIPLLIQTDMTLGQKTYFGGRSFNRCQRPADLVTIGREAFEEKKYVKAYAYFRSAHRKDYLNLDAVVMLKETSDILQVDFDVCKSLRLIDQDGTVETKKYRDRYCK
jgi:hypothetical protein